MSAFLFSSLSATAGEPVQMTVSEMDKVTASYGAFYYSAGFGVFTASYTNDNLPNASEKGSSATPPTVEKGVGFFNNPVK